MASLGERLPEASELDATWPGAPPRRGGCACGRPPGGEGLSGGVPDARPPGGGRRRRRGRAAGRPDGLAPCSPRCSLEANRTVSVDRLIDAVWGESPPASAQNALQVHVHALRARARRRADRHPAPGYAAAVGAGELDVERFEQPRRRGPARRRARALAGRRSRRRRATSRSPRRRPRASRSGGSPRSRRGSTRTSRRAVTPRSPPSSRRSSQSTRTASGSAPSRCSRSTAPGDRPTRSPPTATRAQALDELGLEPSPSSARSNSASSARTPSSTHRPRPRCAEPIASPALRRRSSAGSSSSPR